MTSVILYIPGYVYRTFSKCWNMLTHKCCMYMTVVEFPTTIHVGLTIIGLDVSEQQFVSITFKYPLDVHLVPIYDPKCVGYTEI